MKEGKETKVDKEMKKRKTRSEKNRENLKIKIKIGRD